MLSCDKQLSTSSLTAGAFPAVTFVLFFIIEPTRAYQTPGGL